MWRPFCTHIPICKYVQETDQSLVWGAVLHIYFPVLDDSYEITLEAILKILCWDRLCTYTIWKYVQERDPSLVLGVVLRTYFPVLDNCYDITLEAILKILCGDSFVYIFLSANMFRKWTPV